jgi:hypothetical protein
MLLGCYTVWLWATFPTLKEEAACTSEKSATLKEIIKWREANHSPPSCMKVKKVDLYLRSPIRLHGMVLLYLFINISYILIICIS